MALVYLAEDLKHHRQVALKIPRLQGRPVEMTARFALERNILATLEYPGIARLYDAGVDAGGVPYIAMEYVQGEPLVAWCDARGLDCWLSLETLMGCGVGICNACPIPTRPEGPRGAWPNVKCCVEGPVFKTDEIALHALGH